MIDKSTRQPLEFVECACSGTGYRGFYRCQRKFSSPGATGYLPSAASFLGYKTELTPEYRVNHVTPYVQIELEEENASLNEVVVTASPFQKVPESPVSLRVIGLQEIEKAPGANLIFQSCTKLSGVAFSPIGYRNDLIVRGGGPSETVSTWMG